MSLSNSVLPTTANSDYVACWNDTLAPQGCARTASMVAKTVGTSMPLRGWGAGLFVAGLDGEVVTMINELLVCVCVGVWFRPAASPRAETAA